MGAIGTVGCSNSYGSTCGVPGAVEPCLCDDGSQGIEICTKTGEARCEQLASCGVMGQCVGGVVEHACSPLAGGGNGSGGAALPGGGDGDGDGDSTGFVPGTWGKCLQDNECPQGQTCRDASASGAAYCSPPCSQGAQMCPAAPTGSAIPTCQFMGPLGFACILDCGQGASCPDGMECISGPFAATPTCTWIQ